MMHKWDKRWRGLLLMLSISTMAMMLVGCDSGTGNRLAIPPKGFVADVQQGKKLYRRFCFGCHGKDARGSRRGPPLAHKIYEPSHHADLAFYMAVDQGVTQHHWGFGNMQPVSGVSPEDVGHIIAFVRAEQRKVGVH